MLEIWGESQSSLTSRKQCWALTCQEEARWAVDQELEEITDQPSHQISSAGGLEQDWCRNDLSPFLHSTLEHREHRSQGVERHGTPSCASADSQVFIWAKGETLVGGVEGPMSPLWTPPCTLPYLSPSSQESVLFFFCQFTMIVYMPPPPLPPWGGEEGHKALPAPLFLPWNCTR